MTDSAETGARSAEACPACGAHRLAVLSFPDVSGGRPAEAEVVLAGRSADPAAPAIGCLACGTEWADLEAFRRDTRRERADAPAETPGQPR
jgi:hypothetical protein